MKAFRILALGSVLGASIYGCSIEGTQMLGATCVQTRECVGFQDGGVACLPGAGGNNVCSLTGTMGFDVVVPPRDGQSTLDASDAVVSQ